MALSAVVVDPFVETVIDMLRDLKARHGELAFAMVHRSLSSPSVWSLTIAAPWIDRGSRLETTREVRGMLALRLGSMRGQLGSVFVHSTKDAIIQTLAPLMNVAELGTTYEYRSLELSFFDIDEAYCLLSRPELLTQAASAA